MSLRKIGDVEVKNKFVLLRIDINSPLYKKKVLESPRFKESAQTINYLIKNKAKTVILAHQGRKGDLDFTPSLKEHARILSRHTKKQIRYIDGLFGIKTEKAIRSLKAGEALLLRNVRAYEDEANLKQSRFHEFSNKFDIYVNEAFSVSHRAQASIIIPPSKIRSCIGLAFEKEISSLNQYRYSLSSKKSGVFMLGGSKVQDYLPLFDLLKNKENKIIASGVLANLLLITRGYNLGYEKEWAKRKGYGKIMPLLEKINEKYSGQIILPVDFAIGGPDPNKIKNRVEIALSEAPYKEKIWDVGHQTCRLYENILEKSKFVLVKGPLGYAENPYFSYATACILRKISKLTKEKKIFSLLAGGHLTETIKKVRIPNNFSHVSLAGGAAINYLTNKEMPGIKALEKNNGS